jgi:orsellinic acid/F9775 biosynthesis protein OrsD
MSSAAALGEHVKDYHQPHVRVQYPAGSAAATTTIIARLNDGFFHCPCGWKSHRPRQLQAHAKMCNDTGRCAPVAASAAEATGSDASLLQTTAMWSDPRDCTDADGLAELGLLVNTQAKIIICSACGYAVGADHLAAHMRAHHKGLARLPEGFGHQLVEKYGVKRLPERPAVHDGEPGTAIGGLPIYPGFRCATCAYFCRGKASMLAHIRRSHREDQDGRRREDTEGGGGPPPASMTACRVQTIFTGLSTRYFGVLDDDDDQERRAAAGSLWAIVERNLDEQEERRAAAAAAAAATAGRLPNNLRLRDPFILRTKWDQKLREEHSEDDYVRFAALPRDDEGRGLKKLSRMALDYIHLVSKEVDGGSMLLRRKMMALSE